MKKIITVLIILTLFLTISSTSAIDVDKKLNEANERVNNATLDLNKNISEFNDNLNRYYSLSNTDKGSLNDLNTLISSSTLTDGVYYVNLEKDYMYKTGDSVITISNNNLIINGNGHIIDGKKTVSLFIITGENVTIENLTLINAYSSSNGGAIRWGSSSSNGANGYVNNCTFFNNSAYYCGGAIYWYGLKGRVNNSFFLNNRISGESVSYTGGAIYWSSVNPSISNSLFFNNTAKANGGGLFLYGANSIITNSLFINNRAETTRMTSSSSGKGGAIYFNGLNTTIINSIFINNSANSSTASNGLGGAIYFYNTKALINNSIFINNNVTGSGGAIYTEKGNGTLYNVVFINNRAKTSGGGAYWLCENMIINQTLFYNNSANTGGGFYGIKGSVTRHNGKIQDSAFIKNNASTSAGIYWDGAYSNITNSIFIDNNASSSAGLNWIGMWGVIINCTFLNNTAFSGSAAMSWSGANGKMYNCTFHNNKLTSQNTAVGAVGWGGATGSINDCNFTNNYGVQGGGLSVSGKSTTVLRCNFINNTAFYYGAGLYCAGDSVTVNYCNFFNNKINTTLKLNYYSGGAIHIRQSTGVKVTNCNFINNSANSGGAIGFYKVNSYNTFTNNINYCNFINNTAKLYGGAIYGSDSFTGGIASCIFINNSAGSGGAVYWYDKSTKVSSSKFYNNSATTNGGAIYWTGSTGTISSSDFINNNATNGGAIYWTGTDGNLNNNKFYYNNASQNGGTVYWTGANGIINNNKIYNSTANNGGAIYITNARFVSLFNIELIDNSAELNGGAVYWGNNTGTLMNFGNLSNSVFINNNASYGGAIYWLGTSGFVNNSKFSNNAAIEGGALYWNNTNGTVYNSNLTLNNAEYGAGIYWRGINGTVNKTQFINNTAKLNGGAIYWSANNSTNETNNKIIDSTFIYNTANYGGAVYWNSTGNILNSNFTRNNGTNGSAIYNTGELNITNTIFTENKAKSYTLTIINTDPIFKASLQGGDNILNSIYNNGLININGTEPSNTPNTLGYYQSDLESYQNITVKLYDNECNVIKSENLTTDIYGTVTFERTIPANKIEFTHLEDEYYTYITNSQTLPGGKYTTITGENITIHYGENKTFKITLKDEDNNILPNKNISLNYGEGIKEYITNSQGEIELNLSAWNIGEYNINYKFNGDINYYPSENISNVNITPKLINTTITSTNISLNSGEDINLSIVLMDVDGNLLVGMDVSVDFGSGSAIFTTDSSGVVSIPLASLGVGNYSVSFKFLGDGVYSSCENSTWINVTESIVVLVNTTITAPDIIQFEGDSNSLVIVLMDVDGNLLVGMDVIVDFGSGDVVYVTDSSGVVSIPLASLGVGNYSVSFKFLGDSVYNSCENSSIVNIISKEVPIIPRPTISTIISSSNIIMNISENKDFIINLSDINGNPLEGRLIVLNYGYNDVYLITDMNGLAYLPLNTLSEGIYNITYRFFGDINYLPSMGRNIVNVLINGSINNTNTSNITTNDTNVTNNTNITPDSNITEVIIVSDNLIKYYGDSDSFTGRLISNMNSNPIAGQHISINLKRLSNGLSKVYDVVTDYNGRFSLPINLGAGYYAAELHYDGLNLDTVQYSSASDNFNIIVLDKEDDFITTILTANTFNHKVNAGLSFNGTLLSLDGSPIAGQHISLNLTRLSSGANKVYNVVSDYRGFFSLPINLNPGEYTAYCTYNGVEKYKSSNDFATITVY